MTHVLPPPSGPKTEAEDAPVVEDRVWTAADAEQEPDDGAHSARPREHSRRQPRGLAARIGIIAALATLAVIFAYPFVWLVSASFKPRGEVFDNAIVPNTFTLENYVRVWQEAPLALWILNTVIVTVLAAVAVTLSSAMVAWGFSHYRFRFRGLLFGLVLATMMLPGAVTMIPTFLIWNSVGLTDTLALACDSDALTCQLPSSHSNPRYIPCAPALRIARGMYSFSPHGASIVDEAFSVNLSIVDIPKVVFEKRRMFRVSF